VIFTLKENVIVNIGRTNLVIQINVLGSLEEVLQWLLVTKEIGLIKNEERIKKGEEMSKKKR